MKSNKEIRQYTNSCIQKYGVQKFKRYLSEAIHDLSTGEDAISNVNQLLFFTRVLLYLKQSY